MEGSSDFSHHVVVVFWHFSLAIHFNCLSTLFCVSLTFFCMCTERRNHSLTTPPFHCVYPSPYFPAEHLLIPSSWVQASRRRRKRCPRFPRWPWRWVSLHRAHYGCPPWPSEADAAQSCCPRRAAARHNTSGCGEAPHGHRDLLSEARWQGRAGRSKAGEANYGEENTWREGEKCGLEGKCEETIFYTFFLRRKPQNIH